MSTNRNEFELTDAEIRRLLHDINSTDNHIEPVSLEEVEAIEAEFQTFDTSSIGGADQPIIGELIEEYASDFSPVPGILKRAQELSIEPNSLALQLRLGVDIVMKLERRLLEWVPDTLVWMLAMILQVNKTEVYGYLQQQPLQPAIAASSTQPPSKSRTQTWKEAIETSRMSPEDKEFWLQQI